MTDREDFDTPDLLCEEEQTPPRGFATGAATLTASRVQYCRWAHKEGKATIPELAAKFGVKYLAMWRIINRKTWAWVDDIGEDDSV